MGQSPQKRGAPGAVVFLRASSSYTHLQLCAPGNSQGRQRVLREAVAGPDERARLAKHNIALQETELNMCGSLRGCHGEPKQEVPIHFLCAKRQAGLFLARRRDEERRFR